MNEKAARLVHAIAWLTALDPGEAEFTRSGEEFIEALDDYIASLNRVTGKIE